jgi:hypothetical protein
MRYPSLSFVAFIAILCVLSFYIGEKVSAGNYHSPCVYSFESDGKTYCELDSYYAGLERR